MENMKTQFEERARVLLERMTVLGTKQEEMLEAQGHLGNELALVGGKVSAVSEQVGFSNHAILMLCGALSEMAKRVGISNGRYVKELENLSRSVHSLPAGHMGGMAALGGGMAAAGGNLVSFMPVGGVSQKLPTGRWPDAAMLCCNSNLSAISIVSLRTALDHALSIKYQQAPVLGADSAATV